jgi:uncharacterized membrane protein YgcG
MRKQSFLSTAIVIFSFGTGYAAPNEKEFIPSSQTASFQPQADRLASSIAAAVRSAENSSRSLSSASREMAIQSLVQSTIMASGDDPRVVLAALQAFSLCPTAAGKYTVSQIPVSCTDLKKPLSPEARQALASLEKVIVAMVDQTDAPGALGLSGAPPFVAPQSFGRGGAGRGNGSTSGSQANTGSGSDGSSIVSQPGPGGGGSSGYNTN